MKNSIKVWPHLNDQTQAIVPYFDASLNKENTMYIDFSNIQRINSSGAALSLVKLIKSIRKYENKTWSVEQPENLLVKDFMTKSGFNNILNSRIANKDLLWTLENSSATTNFEQSTEKDIITTSFPIYYLNHKKSDYRGSVEDYIDWVIETFSQYIKKYSLRLNILSKLLKEIAKNSEDHTSDNAIFGIDIIENIQTKESTILFSFCDLGVGIHENIKKHMRQDKRYREEAADKLGIVDSYHWAFTPGFTTSKDPKNKGIGMAMILDCSRILDLELSIFDARSMGFIPKINSHSEIRRNFWNTGNPVGFYYYGKLTLKNENT